MKPKAQIEYKPLGALRELPGNPRTIKKDQFEKLKTSLQNNADYFEARPLILSDRTGELVILAGNQRYKAAKAIGLEQVPTVTLHGLTEEREREIIIRDNVNNGEWDMDALANEWDAGQLQDWGVDVPEIKAPDLAEENGVQDLDASEITIASASIYGQNSDIVVAVKIPENEAEKLLATIEEKGSEKAAQAIMEALHAL